MCRYDTIGECECVCAAILAAIPAAWIPCAGACPGRPDPIVVSSEHPRFFLRPARLRLLRRERERAVPALETISTPDGRQAPPCLSRDLRSRSITKWPATRTPDGKAIAWALGPGADLRQMALVFDWCQEVAHRNAIESPGSPDSSAAFSRAAATRRSPPCGPGAFWLPWSSIGAPARRAGTEIDEILHKWWQGEIVPAINAGRELVLSQRRHFTH